MVRWLLLLILAAIPAAAQEPLPADRARLQLILDPMDAPPYEGQMLLGTIRGEYRVQIALEDLSIPRSPSFDWMQLDRDRWSLEQIDGLPTQVLQRRIALFPQRAGTLTFPALQHRLTIVAADGGRSEHVTSSPPLPVTVRPALGQPWLPVRAIEFSDEWSEDPAMLALGDTVKRRVVLRALGATEQMLPTQPSLNLPWLISFPSPSERATELTPLGPLTTLVWEWSLRPKTGERGVLPAIEIPYFDLASQRPGSLVLPAMPLAYAAAPREGAARAWRSRFAGLWYPAAGFLLGLVVTALASGSGRRLRSRAEFADVLARLGLDPARRRLRHAACKGDAMAMRQAALDLASRLPTERAKALRQTLEPLDRMLFDVGAPVRVALRPLARELLRQ